VVEKVAELFEVDPLHLEKALTARTITTGVGKRDEKIVIPLDTQSVLIFFYFFQKE
jgi:myosin heavy subunit